MNNPGDVARANPEDPRLQSVDQISKELLNEEQPLNTPDDFMRTDSKNQEYPPLLVTYGQAARMLGLSERTVFSMVRDGVLTPRRFGRSVRISVEAIRRLAHGDSGSTGR